MLLFHRIVVTRVKWDIHEGVQILVSLFSLIFTYTVVVGCLTYPQRFIWSQICIFAEMPGLCIQASVCVLDVILSD